MCRLDATDLPDYLEYGIIVAESSDRRVFSHVQVECLQRARRLQTDLEINHAGAALALDLLDTIAALELDLALLKR